MIGSVLLVMGSCTGCMSIVELLVRSDPGCMDLMTFSTFLFIAIEGAIFGTNLLSEPRRIPIMYKYVKLVVTFFFVSVMNNKALSYHIPVPLCIIFRSGSLLTSLIMGVLILKKSYSLQKYLSVFLVTVGIIVCTMASSDQYIQERRANVGNAESYGSYSDWIIGITMLACGLLASSYLGVCQERLFGVYGRVPREALFYVHALALPGFVTLFPQIYEHVLVFNESQPVRIPVIGNVPYLWLYLLACDFVQYCCIRSVYRLTVQYSALSVTLVITLRKFLSLLFSIWYFRNPFTMVHWLGTALVFGGSFLFSNIYGDLKTCFLEQINSYDSLKKKKAQ